jgi:hypothetical protein
MALSKPKRLVNALFRKTQKGEIDWEESLSDNTFQVSFKDHTVQLGIAVSQEGSRIIVVSVLNEEGVVVDRFNDEELDHEDGERGAGPWYRMMQELHNLALRHARGADKALNSILSEIEEDPDLPF